MLPVTVWMNMPSHHQGALFNALASRTDLRVVYDHELTQDRRDMGWPEDPHTGYECTVLDPSRKVRQALSIAGKERRRLHIFGGIWAELSFASALVVLGLSKSRFAIYAEAPTDRKLLGVVPRRTVGTKWLRSAFGGWVARRASGLLAVSHFSADYYSELGFPEDRIYPFGYFRESPPCAPPATKAGGREILFVGKLDYRKGVDLLLDAVVPLLAENTSLRLSLIGSGAEREKINQLVQASGLSDRITVEGVLPASEIPARLTRADILVLPSRGDGWGMVVNEAFLAGIPVIVSDRCGAADLICHGVNGYVFPSEDTDELRSCLRAFTQADQSQMRSAVAQTGSALAIPTVADYLVACLAHMSGSARERPVAPWQQIITGLQKSSSNRIQRASWSGVAVSR